MTITIRAAARQDQEAIEALVRSERMNPFDLDWRRFLVAADARGLAGTVQLRNHFDDSHELGSLVVRRDVRGLGIATRLIDTLLMSAPARVYMITGARFAARYARWGFARIDALRAPAGIMRNYMFGRLVGFVSRVTGRTPNPLAVLTRAA